MRTFGWNPTELELQVRILSSAQTILNVVVYSFARILSTFQEMISVIDQDGNGVISFHEFVWLMTRYEEFIFLD